MHQKLDLASPWEVARLRGLVEHSAVGGYCVAVQHLIDLQKGVFISTADNLFKETLTKFGSCCLPPGLGTTWDFNILSKIAM